MKYTLTGGISYLANQWSVKDRFLPAEDIFQLNNVMCVVASLYTLLKLHVELGAYVNHEGVNI